MLDKNYIKISLILLGLTSLSFQIILLREFLSVFSGNELSIGIILSNWLIAVSIGSYISGYLEDRIKNKEKLFIILQLVCAFLLLVDFITINLLKPLLQRIPTEMIGIILTIIYSFIVLIPVCFLFGCWFVFGCKLLETKISGETVGKSYIYELIGSILGGILTSFILIKYFSNLEIVCIIFCFNFLVIASILYKSSLKKSIMMHIIILTLILFFIIGLTGRINIFNKILKSIQWYPFELVENKNSIYGNISVIRVIDQYSFYENGTNIFTTNNEQYNEELVNLCLLSHPSPKKILLIGGGIGNIEQILKHKIEEIVYIELDPVLIELEKKYIKKDNIFSDPRLKIYYTDSRFYIKRLLEKFDCIIIDMPDPTTGTINRYYTLEFFQELKNILLDNGIFIFALGSSENYMNTELKLLSGSIYRTVKCVFNKIKIIPGIRNYYIGYCSNYYDKNVQNEHYLVSDDLINRKHQNNISLNYLTDYYINYLCNNDRINKIYSWITEKMGAELNKDIHPVCYFYGLLYWASHFNQSVVKILMKIQENNFFIIILIISFFIVLFLIPYIFKLSKDRLIKSYLLLLIMIFSFASMALELITLFSFQTVYGYLYYKIGILITLSLAGISFGSWLSTKLFINTKKLLLVIFITGVVLSIYYLGLPYIIKLSAKIYLLLAFISGLPIGIIFPISNQLLLVRNKNNENLVKIVSLSYGFDLLGATVATFLISVLFIPVFGISETCFIISIIIGFTMLLIKFYCKI